MAAAYLLGEHKQPQPLLLRCQNTTQLLFFFSLHSLSLPSTTSHWETAGEMRAAGRKNAFLALLFTTTSLSQEASPGVRAIRTHEQQKGPS